MLAQIWFDLNELLGFYYHSAICHVSLHSGRRSVLNIGGAKSLIRGHVFGCENNPAGSIPKKVFKVGRTWTVFEYWWGPACHFQNNGGVKKIFKRFSSMRKIQSKTKMVLRLDRF